MYYHAYYSPLVQLYYYHASKPESASCGCWHESDPKWLHFFRDVVPISSMAFADSPSDFFL